jgi:hypothetical protein
MPRIAPHCTGAPTRRVRLSGSTLTSIVRMVPCRAWGRRCYRRHEEPRRFSATVRQLLTDPDSAVFRNEHLSTSPPNTWCGGSPSKPSPDGASGPSSIGFGRRTARLTLLPSLNGPWGGLGSSVALRWGRPLHDRGAPRSAEPSPCNRRRNMHEHAVSLASLPSPCSASHRQARGRRRST